jgi:hypothetical protein
LNGLQVPAFAGLQGAECFGQRTVAAPALVAALGLQPGCNACVIKATRHRAAFPVGPVAPLGLHALPSQPVRHVFGPEPEDAFGLAERSGAIAGLQNEAKGGKRFVGGVAWWCMRVFCLGVFGLGFGLYLAQRLQPGEAG